MKNLCLLMALLLGLPSYAADAVDVNALKEEVPVPPETKTEATTAPPTPDCDCRADIYPKKIPTEKIRPVSVLEDNELELIGRVPKKKSSINLSSVNWGNILVGAAAIGVIGGLGYLAYKSYKDSQKTPDYYPPPYLPPTTAGGFPAYRTYAPPFAPGGSPYYTQYRGYTPWGTPMNYSAMMGTGMPPGVIYNSPMSVGNPYMGQPAYLGRPPAPAVLPVYYTPATATIVRPPVICPQQNYFGTGVPTYTYCY